MTTMTTEKLRDEVLTIRRELRAGAISNTVARSLIMAAKVELDTLKAEMEAARLGAAFESLEYHSNDRTKTDRRLAA
jgi:hypothetical protein